MKFPTSVGLKKLKLLLEPGIKVGHNYYRIATMPKVKSVVNSKEYDITARIINDLKATWDKLYAEGLADPPTFVSLSVVACTQLAAIMAVDVGLVEDKLLAITQANYREALKRAPKFS
jgi:hypothetical protein